MLDFIPTGYHGLFYYGYDRGIYIANGIDLNILRGSGAASTVQAVAAGKVDFGFADAGTMVALAETSNVTNVRIVGMVFQTTAFTIIYNKAHISKLTDLNGKTESDFQGSAGQKLFPIFTKINGINLSSVAVNYVSPGVFNQLVALGKVDFTITTINQLANIQPTATQNHIELGTFRLADYGMNIYGAAILTTNDMIKNHPQLVVSFVKASMQSIQGAVQHPQDAIQSLVKYNAQLNSTLALGDFKLIVQNTLPANANATSINPLTLGFTDQNKMQLTINIISQAYGIKPAVAASDLYTNQFVATPQS